MKDLLRFLLFYTFLLFLGAIVCWLLYPRSVGEHMIQWLIDLVTC